MPIPEACPGCNRTLFPDFRDRPSPRWQLRAKLLFFLGAAIAGPMLLSAPFVATHVLIDVDPQRQFVKQERGTIGLLVWVIVGTLSIIIALVFGALAFRMPRIFKLDCKDCGWSETIFVPRVRYGKYKQVAEDSVE